MVITKTGLFAKIFTFESEISNLCYEHHNLGAVFKKFEKHLTNTSEKSCKDLGFKIVQKIVISDPEVSEYQDGFPKTIKHNVKIGDESHTVQISYEDRFLPNGENLQSIKEISTSNIRIFDLKKTKTGLTYILVVSTDNAYTASKKVTFTYENYRSENVYEPKLSKDEKILQMNLTDGTNFTVDLSSNEVWTGVKSVSNSNLNYELKILENGKKCKIQVWQAINPNNKISVDFKCPKDQNLEVSSDSQNQPSKQQGMDGTDDSQSWKIWIIVGAIGVVAVVVIGIGICIVLARRKPPEDLNAETALERQAGIDAAAKIAEDLRRVQEELGQQELARGEQNIYVQAEPEPVVM